MRSAPEAGPAPACAIAPAPPSDGGIRPTVFIIRGGVKSRRLSCATLVFSDVGRARGFRFKIGSAVASGAPGEPEGLSCAATIEATNRAAEAPEKNLRRGRLLVNINPPTS